MIFSGCSNKPTTIVETKYTQTYIPLSLLLIECTEEKAGETVRSLAIAYVKTRSCLRAHQALIDGLKSNYTLEGVSPRRIDHVRDTERQNN